MKHLPLPHIFLSVLLTLLILASHQQAMGQDQPAKLYFESGKFKLLQLTDLHWAEHKPTCPQTEATIRTIVATEQPHLIILTGDIVTDTPAEQGWQSIIRIFNDLKRPFAVTMGNHDAEYLTRQKIYQLLEASPYFRGCYGDRAIKGGGNYTLPIWDTQGKHLKALIYALDSNDYLPADSYGAYDWIGFDQIAWLRQESQRYTAQNGGNPLPALTFFHIPLPEYKALASQNNFLGSMLDDGIASPNINSGLFASLIEMRDAMGVFVGHDHNNDFIGLLHGIALGYGRASGWEAYGQLARGGRIIELTENERQFVTYVVTDKGREATFYYPSGITSEQEMGMSYLPALNVNPTQPGVAYKYYEGKCRTTLDIPKLPIHHQGIRLDISLSESDKKDYFAYQFRTFIRIPQRGVYRFSTYSDDGSRLYIDKQLVVDNDGGHSVRRREGLIALEAGWHELEVDYFESYMGEALHIGIESKHIKRQYIPTSWYFLP